VTGAAVRALPVLPSLRVMLRAAVMAAGWLPFFLADPGTTALLHFTIDNVPFSELRAWV
jgi:hypothetical protein